MLLSLHRLPGLLGLHMTFRDSVDSPDSIDSLTPGLPCSCRSMDSPDSRTPLTHRTPLTPLLLGFPGLPGHSVWKASADSSGQEPARQWLPNAQAPSASPLGPGWDGAQTWPKADAFRPQLPLRRGLSPLQKGPEAPPASRWPQRRPVASMPWALRPLGQRKRRRARSGLEAPPPPALWKAFGLMPREA